MGQMNLAPALGDNFQFYVPVVIVVICFMTLFDVVGRVGRCLGYQDVLFVNVKDDGEWGEVEDGRVLITQGKGCVGPSIDPLI
jgi:hypothetical protein